ncbi:MAG: hypothetical protein ACOYBR_08720 [Fluviibacter sp.]
MLFLLVAKKKPLLLLPLLLLPQHLLLPLRPLLLLLPPLQLLHLLLLLHQQPSNRFCDLGTASAVTKNRPSGRFFYASDG